MRELDFDLEIKEINIALKVKTKTPIICQSYVKLHHTKCWMMLETLKLLRVSLLVIRLSFLVFRGFFEMMSETLKLLCGKLLLFRSGRSLAFARFDLRLMTSVICVSGLLQTLRNERESDWTEMVTRIRKMAENCSNSSDTQQMSSCIFSGV